MGIKGIYGEIGSGQRLALAKLVVEKLEETGRPLRIAVDISIWLFQIQAGKGGTNAPLRTLYYRLLRLLATGVQPIFVFDGPHKPPFKRNKATSAACGSMTELPTKQLLRHFGLPYHIAPGEAEAECALLQLEGIVDAVLSEDVDTLMFGCGLTFRNWKSEENKGPPTHVSVYDANATKAGKSGLDREGMILVALMSGGDYITEGIPGCGIKTACEAARAGYGRSLCKLSRTDVDGIEKWRKDLEHEIRTNEKKYFRVRHKALRIPETFPNKEVLGYYTHPVVSSAAKFVKLKDEINWYSDIDVPSLRIFAAQAFGWTEKIGAKKFIRTLAPALLVSKLQARANCRASAVESELTALDELKLVKSISKRRLHFSADATPELQLIYQPTAIVGLDLDSEGDDSGDIGRDGLAPLGDDGNAILYQSEDEDLLRSGTRSPAKKGLSAYDPTASDKVWVLEKIAKLGVPLAVQAYEESQRNPKKPSQGKPTSRKAPLGSDMPWGAMDCYVTITRPGIRSYGSKISKVLSKPSSSQSNLPPYLAPILQTFPTSQPDIAQRNTSSQPLKSTNVSEQIARPPSIRSVSRLKSASAWKDTRPGNLWTIAPSSLPVQPSTRPGVRTSKPGITGKQHLLPCESSEASLVTSSFANNRSISAACSPTPFRKHNCSHSPSLVLNCPKIVSPRNRRPPDLFSTPSQHDIALNKPHSQSSPDLCLLSLAELTSLPQQLPRLNIKMDGNVGLHREVKREAINIVSSPTSEATTAPAEDIETGLNFQPPPQNLANDKTKKGKFLMLRDSLEGSWKEVDEEDIISADVRGGLRVWRASQVEVLDMTAD